MWSFFSRDPTKDFAYEIGDKVAGLEDKSVWALYEGKHKTTGSVVSIFVFDNQGSSDSQLQLAQNSFKKIKTLRHPNILSYVDGLETDKVLYLVTEPVVPLETYLNSEQNTAINELAISWGLHQISKGLSFLINDCNYIHNNVCMASVFVDKAGEWKLSGIDYMYPASGEGSIQPVKILPALEKYDPPEKSGPGRRSGPKWSSDMWGLGCLIWEVFNGHLPKTSSLKALGKKSQTRILNSEIGSLITYLTIQNHFISIPKNLVPNYCVLVGANPKSRPNPAKFVEACRSKDSFMDNKFVDTMLFLEEIQIKEQSEKLAFFNSLPPVLDTFPTQFCKHKILPQLVHAFQYGNAGSAVVMPLFKLGKLLDADEYQKQILPCIVKLFSSTDRATRVKLLQQIEHFSDYLSVDVVNKQIYPNIAQGFTDTNPVVREHTIKSMLHLAPKLNYKNLNEDLLKHFARLQSKDDQGGIRTNTTVCLGKIACNLNPQMRQKVLVSAYLRAMKDPFPPARQAGILAMAATHNFFSLQESACRLLPALCTSTMDPDKSVRDQTFKAIQCFLGKLEKVSQEPELAADMEKDINTGGSASTAASWAGWAVSGMTSLTSKIYKGKGQSPTPGTPQTAQSKTSKPVKSGDAGNVSEEASKTNKEDNRTNRIQEAVEEQEEEAGEDSWDTTENWEDNNEWGDMQDNNKESTETKEADDEGDWGEDWGSLEDTTPVRHTPDKHSAAGMELHTEPSPWGSSDFVESESADLQSTSSYDWGQNNKDDFFSSMLHDDSKKASLKKPKPTLSSGGVSNTRTQPKTTSQSTNRPSSVKQASSAKTSGGSKSSTGGWEGSGWEGDSGWGDDGWDSLENTENTGQSQMELAKKKREEKKAQRQKELEEKRAARQSSGPMKLGARKIAKD